MSWIKTLAIATSVACLFSLSACQSTTESSDAASIGAVAGGSANSWEWAHTGTAVGASGGYVIGEQARALRHDEVPAVQLAPLAGTKWRLVAAEKGRLLKGVIGTIYRFHQDGKVTAVDPDANLHDIGEYFRVVGDVLIIYSADYVYNFEYANDGKVMTIQGKGIDQKNLKLTLVKEMSL